MSEYNIQMNKYNALSADYDQLYPATKIKNVNGLGTALQNKADTSSVYSKEESISASTRTALSLPDTATPDDALAEIARQLSESGGLSIDLLWENAAPDSSFAGGIVQISGITLYDIVLVEFKDNSDVVQSNATSFIVTDGFKSTAIGFNVYARMRFFSRNSDGVNFATAYKYKDNRETEDNSQLVPVRIYGIKGATDNV